MKETKYEKDLYKKMVDEVSPPSKIIKDCIYAFFVGGSICTVGQFIQNTLIGYNVSEKMASTYTSVILIFFGVLLTGLTLYEKLGKRAGAGSIVPITGFANSVASPAMEFKKEGWIAGVGAKMFVLAGPVLLYGVLTSIIVGIFYYISNYIL